MKPFEVRGEKMRGPSVYELLRYPDKTPAQELRVLSWMAYNLGDFVPTTDLCRIMAPEAKTVTQDMVDMTHQSVCRARACLNEKEWRLYSLQSPSGYFLIPMVELQENEDRIVRIGDFRPIPNWITEKTPDYDALATLCRTTQVVRINKGVKAALLLYEFLYVPLMDLVRARVEETGVPYNSVAEVDWSMIREFLLQYNGVWDLRRTESVIQLVKREEIKSLSSDH
jgi:hypothetical protein